jgi:L-asparaginase / beta-aspartyl-peptidase
MTVAFLLACVGVSFVLQTRKVKLVRVKPKQNTKTFSIVVHGGAYTIPNDLKLKAENGCRAAALAGARILQKNGSAMDAVEAAVNALELNPVFDAGVGSVLTSEGNIEMDAAIMNGRTLEAGAVACVTSVRNPISLARKVAEKTSHVMLVGHGADKFAEKIRIPKCSLGDLATAAARAELLAFQGYDHVVENVFRAGHDTVGAVAMDGDGNIAAGTSTGGITASMPGRIGDSSIVSSAG